MQERRALTHQQINKELMRSVVAQPLWHWGLILLLGTIVAGGASAVGWMVNQGIGVTGLHRPVMWGFMITNFVFWVGISHAGVMLSAILRLSQAEWRRPATRAAEVLTIFALMTALTMPLVHTGRPWRVVYWVFPYDFARGIWPNIRSPLVWDPSAITTYLTATILFVYVLLLPDLAIIRDRTKGITSTVYGVLALGWRGTFRQWKFQLLAGIFLSALILPVFVSVHSIVSWDFGVSIAGEGWHNTIFAPYFVIGAVHSGVSAVVTVMIALRWLFKWDNYIRPEHIDSLGRLLILVALSWFFFFSVEFLMGLYGGEGAEVPLRETQLFGHPWKWLFITFLLCAFFVPVSFWLFRGARRNMWIMFVTTILVNVGMWLERFIIIVPSLMRKQPLTFDWSTYRPSPVEITIVGATFALVFLGVITFTKFLPLMPISDIKEGQTLADEIKIGRRTVPAVKREE